MASFLSGIIFDLNGVLWWDGRLQELAWGDFSAQVRGYALSSAEMAQHVQGRNNRHTLNYLTCRELAAAEVEQLSEEKEVVYRRLCLAEGDGFRLSPGAPELLEYLVGHDIPHTIATASGKGNLDFFIENLDLARWFAFDKIVYDNGRLAGKPAPDFYLAAAEKIGLPPGHCIVVEDSLSGARAARAAGIGRIMAMVGDNDDILIGDSDPVDEVIQSFHEFDRRLLA